jgi:hypothetical protein
VPYVRGHVRAGRWVRPHWRRPPGAGAGVTGALLVVAIVVASLTGAGDALPRRHSPPAELLGVDLATVRELAAGIEPYVRANDATIVDVRVRVEQPAPPLPLSARRR